jgi:hypothetical protein
MTNKPKERTRGATNGPGMRSVVTARISELWPASVRAGAKVPFP